MKNRTEYPFEVRPLTNDEGGGWLVVYPDLPGCMSDGETPEEAMNNGKDALAAWLRQQGTPDGKFRSQEICPVGSSLPECRGVCMPV